MVARVRIEPPDGASFERELEVQEVVLGRGSSAGLVIPDSSVSRQHLKLFQRDGRWWAEDLGATNGSLLNDRALKTPTALGAGDTLKIGSTVVHFLAALPSASTASPTGGVAVPLAGNVAVPSTGGVRVPAPPPDAGSDRQAARLATLNEIHRALATPISLTELLELILARSFDVLKPEEGVILLKQRNGELKPAATRRPPGASGDYVVSRRIVDEVAGKQQPALVLDAAEDQRFAGSQSIIASGVRSVVAAPLTDAEGTIGLIALTSRVSVRQFSDQDLDMLVSLASAAALRVRNVALAEEAAERRALDRELALAHDMQMGMLPRQMPKRPEIRVAAALTPARSVGGDLYDFVLDDEGIWFIVGDVSGHGVGAALWMAVTKTLFRATVQSGVSLEEVFVRINRELCRDNEQMMFVTAIVGRLEFESGKVKIGDAGHTPVFLVDVRGQMSQPSIPKSIAFGVQEDATFAVASFTMTPGSSVLLHTDGATDARNTAGEIFGSDRLQKAMKASAGRTVTELVHGTLGAVNKFAAGAAPEDDLTFLAIEYLGTDATQG